MSLRFLTVADVLELHEEQLHYGGDSGLRSMELLESAVAMPKSGFGDEYFHADAFAMAAAYLFHLCGNHPFVDANKRVALAAAIIFLDINGWDLGERRGTLRPCARHRERRNRERRDRAIFPHPLHSRRSVKKPCESTKFR